MDGTERLTGASIVAPIAPFFDVIGVELIFGGAP